MKRLFEAVKKEWGDHQPIAYGVATGGLSVSSASYLTGGAFSLIGLPALPVAGAVLCAISLFYLIAEVAL